MKLHFQMLPNEHWWGGMVKKGHMLPMTSQGVWHLDPDDTQESDQFAPLFLSSCGRYVWSERPFVLDAQDGEVTCSGTGDICLHEGFGTLREAYLAACKMHFPFTGTLPDSLFFTLPQYNTWCELCTEQTAEGILNYAKGILAQGLPAGILMIDNGWQEDFGVFEFNLRKIPDPKGMMDALHRMGFTVMLWVTPIIASAGARYEQLLDEGWLIRTAQGEPAIRKWWSGYSAILDLTNPDAASWFHGQLQSLMTRYGIDGFKFDAGDGYFYADDDLVHTPMLGREQTAVFDKIGAMYPLNELRAVWKYGGQPIVSRLHDKRHTWDESGLNTLIPQTIMQGLLGYSYCCPDMMGGGIVDYFQHRSLLDEELFVRWAQANACMGMLQMSVAPWRILSAENSARVVAAMQMHVSLGPRIYELARHAAATGEPIVRHMAYQFPGQGFEGVCTQFMLGSDLLVAPVLEKGATDKTVCLPLGRWQSENGDIYPGGQRVTLPVTLDTLPIFTLISN